MAHSPISSTPVTLPEDDFSRAFWLGHESARYMPFDPFVYLERAALAGAGVVVEGGMLMFFTPADASPEAMFLEGWRKGCPGSDAMFKAALNANPEIAQAHRAIVAMKFSQDGS